jgi:hypothetical protein
MKLTTLYTDALADQMVAAVPNTLSQRQRKKFWNFRQSLI